MQQVLGNIIPPQLSAALAQPPPVAIPKGPPKAMRRAPKTARTAKVTQTPPTPFDSDDDRSSDGEWLPKVPPQTAKTRGQAGATKNSK